MKKIILTTIIGLILLNCEKDKGYSIQGEAKGVYNGVRVYLKSMDFKNYKEKILDTAIIFDEKFNFKGSLENPEYRLISVDNVTGNLALILENSPVKLSINKNDIQKSEISGSTSHLDYKAYETNLNELLVKRKDITSKYRSSLKSEDKKLMDSLKLLLDKNRETIILYPLDYINSNPDKFFSLLLIEQEIDKKRDIEKYKEAFENLNNEIKNSPRAQKLSIKINGLYKINNLKK